MVQSVRLTYFRQHKKRIAEILTELIGFHQEWSNPYAVRIILERGVIAVFLIEKGDILMEQAVYDRVYKKKKFITHKMNYIKDTNHDGIIDAIYGFLGEVRD